MSITSQERPNAQPLIHATSASIVHNGRYLPPPKDKDEKLWVRANSLIQANTQALYSLWRAVQRAPEWQEQIVSVSEKGPRLSHWVMKSGDSTIEWDLEVLADEPGKRIAWRSVDGDYENAGEVIFEQATDGRGTVVTVLQEFRMGKLASAWATTVGHDPKQTVIENLRHFKALVETGEIPRTEPQPHGERGVIGKSKASMYGEGVPVPPGDSATN